MYQPQFPEQTLDYHTALTFHLPVSGPRLLGEIDVTHPHAINQIIVGDLGNEELLVCVCDDGDVVAYATRTLATLMEDAQTVGSSRSNEIGKIRTFFHRNVGRSAWGIAIHKAGRLIAVSANSRTVTVFAFALGSESSSSSDSEDEDDNGSNHSTTPFLGTVEWEKRPRLGTIPQNLSEECLPAQRSTTNFELILSGHGANVPNVAFCNTEDDRTGRYLVSTDINGATYTWDLWQGRGVTLSITTQPSHGWGVLCLDLRSFRPTVGDLETYGCVPKPHGGNKDISASRNHVKGANSWHPLSAGFPSAPAALLPFGMVYETELQAGLPEESDDDEDWDDMEVEENDDLDMDLPQYTSLQGFASNPVPATANIHSEHNESPQGDSAAPETLPDLYLNPTGDGGIIGGITGDSSSTASFPPISLPFSILQTSTSDIIFRPSAIRPYILLRQPLAQNIPPSLHSLTHFSRLNMVTQVPELGLVLVASQIGRVSLLTLTHMRSTKQLAFRLDCILPSKEQEAKGERPMLPLLGMAVGPIQGREKRAGSASGGDSPEGRGKEAWRAIEGSRRFRLMLYYCDHTVLSYELSRPSGMESSGHGGDELLVF